MKTAEQIAEKMWEKYYDSSTVGLWQVVSKDAFLAALKEYGEAVRQKAAGVAREQDGVHDDIYARAIERMELP